MRPFLKYKQHKVVRWSLLTALVLALFLIGHLEDQIKDEFTFWLDKSTSTLKLTPLSGILVESVYSSKFISLIYRLLYFSICISFIHVYFLQSSITRWALRSYICLLLLTLLLYGIADKLRLEQLRSVAFRIDSLMVSPMPIIILIPALLLAVDAKKQVK